MGRDRDPIVTSDGEPDVDAQPSFLLRFSPSVFAEELPCVFEHVRVDNFHRAARFLALWEDEGCRMVRMTCEEHDRLAAGSQFVTHLTGRLLSRLSLGPSPIATQGFKALLKLVDNTCSDSFDLFYAL